MEDYFLDSLLLGEGDFIGQPGLTGEVDFLSTLAQEVALIEVSVVRSPFWFNF